MDKCVFYYENGFFAMKMAELWWFWVVLGGFAYENWFFTMKMWFLGVFFMASTGGNRKFALKTGFYTYLFIPFSTIFAHFYTILAHFRSFLYHFRSFFHIY
jgi:hypothetical protein